MKRSGKLRVQSLDDNVIQAIQALGGEADAPKLLKQLTSAGLPPYAAQLAIQRAFERQMIDLGRDWRFRLSAPLGAAA